MNSKKSSYVSVSSSGGCASNTADTHRKQSEDIATMVWLLANASHVSVEQLTSATGRRDWWVCEKLVDISRVVPIFRESNIWWNVDKLSAAELDIFMINPSALMSSASPISPCSMYHMPITR